MNKKFTFISCCTPFLLLMLSVRAQTLPQLVKDLGTTPVTTGSAPGNFVVLNGITYFSAKDAVNGRELWKSDGTTAGTVMVKDIFNGTRSANPANLVVMGSNIYFTADNGIHGDELWRTDGTGGGTVMVKDIRPGAGSSTLRQLKVCNGALYFTADDGTTGQEPWKSDGTETGTFLLYDIFSGAGGSSVSGMTTMGTSIYFAADDNTHGTELWKTDGTTGGTALVKDITPGTDFSRPGHFAVLNNNLFFAATNNSTTGTELWKSDGTEAGTVLLMDINTGTNSSNPSYLYPFNGAIYFNAYTNAKGDELWKTDGTAAGTALLKDIFPFGSTGSAPANFIASGGQLFFTANSTNSDGELWKTDGTTGGTVLVKNTNSGTNNYYSSISFMTDATSTLYFSAKDAVTGQELWKSDGTTAGTVLVKDIKTGSPSGSPLYLTYTAGQLLFSAEGDTKGTELWKSDGTGSGTSMVKDIFTGTTGASPIYITAFGNYGYFASTGGLWRSDATEAGTQRLSFNDGSAITLGYQPLVVCGGFLYFIHTAAQEQWLCKTDGTQAGTVTVASAGQFSLLTSAGSTLYFTTITQTGATPGNALWKSDGTTAGTVMLQNFPYPAPDPFGGYSNPDIITNLTANGNALYFMAAPAAGINALWKSDGTPAGTVQVKQVSGQSLTIMNNVLYFNGSTSSGDRGLWKSDGTTAGTILVKAMSIPGEMLAIDNILYLSSTFGTYGYSLWKSDGTTAGTVPVKDIYDAGSGGNAQPAKFTNVDGTLFFRATNTGSSEPWKSDGTTAGTVMIKDIYTGSKSSEPDFFAAIDGYLYCSATDSLGGSEVWKSNGTAAGTNQLFNIDGNDGNSFPRYYCKTPGNILFSATHPETGIELFRIGTFYSNGNASPDNLPNWKSNRNGSGNTLSALKGGNELYIQNGHTLTVATGTTTETGIDAIEIENGGALVNNGILVMKGLLHIQVGGSFVNNNTCRHKGTIAVEGSFTNNGIVEPGNSPGVLFVNGNYRNGSSGTLRMELGGSVPGTDYDQLDVAETATLQGTLDIILADGAAPLPGQSYTVVKAKQINGGFTSINWPVGVTGNVTYTAGTAMVNITAVVLPARLVQFTGRWQGSSVVLNWQTNNELDMARYEVEWSTDGRSFAKVGEQTARNTNGSNSYQLLHEPNAPVNFYRIRMVNRDGRSTYSSVIRLSSATNAAISLYPNPVRDQLIISLPGNQLAGISLTNSAGQLLRSVRMQAGAGSIDMSALAPGIYFVRVVRGQATTVQRIIKQ